MKFFSGRPSRKLVRKLVRALYQGVRNQTPSEDEYQRWVLAVENGMSLSAVASIVTEEVFLQRLQAQAMRGQKELEFRQNLESSAPPRPAENAVRLFVPPGHFYSPIVDPKEGAETHDRLTRAPWPKALPGIALDGQAMVATFRELVPLFQTSGLTAAPPPGFRYGYDNNHYSWGDGSVLSAMIRKFRPSRIIEIGSGWSSACMLDTLQRNPDLVCEVTFIEPHPELLKERLGADYSKHRVFAQPVQQIDPEIFATLGEGDILFIDSTHVVKTGSDVCFELFEVLPRLKRGVIVHVHDIFWPFEYPRGWIVDENRSWNELYAYRALLTDNPDWEIVMFNNYLSRIAPEVIEAAWPPFLNNSGGALWLRKR